MPNLFFIREDKKRSTTIRKTEKSRILISRHLPMVVDWEELPLFVRASRLEVLVIMGHSLEWILEQNAIIIYSKVKTI